MTAQLRIERLEATAVITLCRPRRLNALTLDLLDEIYEALDRLDHDPSCRVVVITGAGRGFCSGLDISEPDPLGQNESVVEVLRRQERIAAIASKLRALQQPVIAAVNGPAAGGGMSIALAADVRVCSPAARFNVAFVRIGLSGCDIGVSYLLPRIVGLGIASEWMLTGRQIDAQEALRTGLANRVTAPDENLLDETLAMARDIARNSPFGVRMTKRVLAQNIDAPSLEAAIQLENLTQVLTTRTSDGPEALAAFQEQRKPQFSGT